MPQDPKVDPTSPPTAQGPGSRPPDSSPSPPTALKRPATSTLEEGALGQKRPRTTSTSTSSSSPSPTSHPAGSAAPADAGAPADTLIPAQSHRGDISDSGARGGAEEPAGESCQSGEEANEPGAQHEEADRMPNGGAYEDILRRAVQNTNRVPPSASTGCISTAGPEAGDKALNLPADEEETPALYAWGQSVGLVPSDRGSRDSWKHSHENVVHLRSDINAVLRRSHDCPLPLQPVYEDVCEVIRLLEGRLAETEAGLLEDLAAGRPLEAWSLDVQRLLQEKWPLILEFDDADEAQRLGMGKVPLYRYKQGWFEATGTTSSSSKTLPTAHEPKPDLELCEVLLPLSLPLVILVAATFLRHIDDSLPVTEGFGWTGDVECDRDVADYLLSLIEGEDVSSWREVRPRCLPFEAPPRASGHHGQTSELVPLRQFPAVADWPATLEVVDVDGEDDDEDGDEDTALKDAAAELAESKAAYAEVEESMRQLMAAKMRDEGAGNAMNWLRGGPQVRAFLRGEEYVSQDPREVQRAMEQLERASVRYGRAEEQWERQWQEREEEG